MLPKEKKGVLLDENETLLKRHEILLEGPETLHKGQETLLRGLENLPRRNEALLQGNEAVQRIYHHGLHQPALPREQNEILLLLEKAMWLIWSPDGHPALLKNNKEIFLPPNGPI